MPRTASTEVIPLNSLSTGRRHQTAGRFLQRVHAMFQRRLQWPVEAARSLLLRLPGAAWLRQAGRVRQLRANPLFACLETQVLEALASCAEEFVLPAGQYLFRKGDASGELYLLMRGEACVLMERGGREEVVDRLGSGVVFGEVAMLTGGPRSASIRIATASTLLRISRTALLPLLEAHAGLRQALWQAFAVRRFEELVAERACYRVLGRKGRLAWLRRGEHRELAANEALLIEPGTSLLVLGAPVEIQQGGMRLATQGPTLLETHQPLRMVARERAQIILLSSNPFALSAPSGA